MIESGIVRKIENDNAWILLQKGEQCHGCTACQVFGDGSAEILAANKINAGPGDRVEIEIAPKELIKHSAVIFLIPVLALIVGYFLGVKYLTALSIGEEPAGIIGSLGLMIVSYFFIVVYDRHVGKKEESGARIVRKI
ncbi:MAG: SoxR reducing system RseC family protein [Calditrichaeota bacterium]|nr:SoxR reducing system RseC family protein [Calditrichota bacterium]